VKRVLYFIPLLFILFISGCEKKLEIKGTGLIKTPKMLFKSFRAVTPKAHSGEAPELARDVDLSPLFPTPGDQGLIGSCTAWATAYACKSFHENKERAWGVNSPDHQFSPSYIYNQINGGVDQGSAIEHAAALVIEKGCATFKEMPYTEDYLAQPSLNAYNEAQNYKAVSFARVDYENIEDVKRVLTEGNAVIAGLEIFENFYYYTGGVYKHTEGASQGGHAMCVVGYDDGKGAFKIINSWSPNWGEKGYCWISYDIFSKYTLSSIVLYDDVVYHPDNAAAPHNVEASQGSFTDKIEVTWEKAKNAISYRVFRSDKPNENFVKIASTKGTTYIDTATIAPGTFYYYSIRSIGISGESEFSESAKGFAGIIEEELGIPQNLQGLFEDYTIYMRWDQINNIDGYYIYRFEQDKENYLRVGITRDTYFRDNKEFIDGEVLWYIVTSYKDSRESGPSKAFSVVVRLPKKEPVSLPVPRNVIASQKEFENKIIISWDPVDKATEYIIYRWKETEESWNELAIVKNISYEDNEIHNPKEYYKVAARRENRMSPTSEPVLGYLKEHEVKVLDQDITYDDEEYYDETELEDIDYKEEDLYKDDEKIKDKEIVYDRFTFEEEEEKKKKDKDEKKNEKEKEKDKKKENKKEIMTEDEAIDAVRDRIKQKEKIKEKSKKDKIEKDEQKEALERRVRDLVEDGFDDDAFFGSEEEEDDFFGEDESDKDFFSDDDF